MDGDGLGGGTAEVLRGELRGEAVHTARDEARAVVDEGVVELKSDEREGAWDDGVVGGVRLKVLKVAAGGVHIGGAVPAIELGESERLRGLWPGVVEAANLIGSDQIQGRCTVVGNLCNASPAADSVPGLGGGAAGAADDGA